MLPDAGLEARARALSQGLRCLVCRNENIDDSDAPLARDLRLLVREREAARFPAYRDLAGFDFASVRGLSAEVQQKLERVQPETIGQAQRIPGMTPAAISLLLVHLERARRMRVA